MPIDIDDEDPQMWLEIAERCYNFGDRYIRDGREMEFVRNVFNRLHNGRSCSHAQRRWLFDILKRSRQARQHYGINNDD